MDAVVRKRIEDFINGNHIALFMKGRKDAPQCGFSRQVTDVLMSLTNDFETFDVLSDPDVREGIKHFSNWPTIPQLYINGEFVGGCDITLDLMAQGKLQAMLGIKKAEKSPVITLTPSAQGAFERAMDAEKEEGEMIRVIVPANFEHGLNFDRPKADDFVVKIGTIELCIDPYSAARASNISIDYVEDKLQGGFSFDNPNAPPPVKEISARELKSWHDDKRPLLLIDVRPQDEARIARIGFSTLLVEMSAEKIKKLPKDAPLVFHCHHGRRSAKVAESFRLKGFTNIHNLKGGIDAWSKEADMSVPTY